MGGGGWLSATATPASLARSGRADRRRAQSHMPTSNPATASAAGCHPRPGAPCVVPLTATPNDPDGDPVTIDWGGCADGTGTTAACEVHQLGTNTALAKGTDPFGATHEGRVSVQGQNRAPVVSASPASGSGAAFPFTWSWSDADGD